MNYTETGNLEKSLRVKVGAPVMLTVNNEKQSIGKMEFATGQEDI